MLREVLARAGSFDLAFLKEMKLPEARQWLRDLPAVGPKTAACVLLFALGMPALVGEGLSWKDLRLRALHSTPIELPARRGPQARAET